MRHFVGTTCEKVAILGGLFTLAERGGFEPPIGINPITDFESAAFDRSATPPYFLSICYTRGGASEQI